MRYFCGGFAALIFLAGCGQMGPLVLPPEPPAPAPATPVTVEPVLDAPASSVKTAPKKDPP